MKSVALAAVAVVALSASAGGAWAKPRHCSASAEGVNGAEVEVTFTVDDQGAVTEREAQWTPPGVEAGDAGMRMLSGAPTLHVSYAGATAESLGAPDSVDTFAMSFATTFKGLTGGQMALSAADGRAWRRPVMVAGDPNKGPTTSEKNLNITMGLAVMAARASDGDEAVNTDLLDGVDKLTRVKAAMSDGAGKTLGEAEFDLSDHAARDALYAKAWAEAVKASENWKKCKKA